MASELYYSQTRDYRYSTLNIQYSIIFSILYTQSSILKTHYSISIPKQGFNLAHWLDFHSSEFIHLVLVFQFIFILLLAVQMCGLRRGISKFVSHAQSAEVFSPKGSQSSPIDLVRVKRESDEEESEESEAESLSSEAWNPPSITNTPLIPPPTFHGSGMPNLQGSWSGDFVRRSPRFQAAVSLFCFFFVLLSFL